MLTFFPVENRFTNVTLAPFLSVAKQRKHFQSGKGNMLTLTKIQESTNNCHT
jgi:hypothetical protein